MPTGGMGPGGDNPPDKPGEAGAAVETNMIAAEETDRQNSSKAAVSQVNQVEQDRMASENPESATDPSGEHASFGGNRGAPTSNLSAAWWELAICFVALLLAVAAVACFRRRRI